MKADHAGVAGTRFWLIRHGETEWNAAGLWQGHLDSQLTASGLQQAESVAREFAARSIDRIVCSDLGRCRATVAPLARASGVVVEYVRELRELDVGHWSGLSRDEIRRRDPETLARFDAREDVRAGGGERRSELARRVHAFVEQLAGESPGQAIVLVTHSGVVRALKPMAHAPHATTIETTLAEIRGARGADLPDLQRV